MRGNVSILFHKSAPAGEHDDRRVRRFLLEQLGHLPAVEIRHAQIGDDHVKRPAALPGYAEFVQPGLPAVADLHLVAVAFKDFLDEFTQQRFVVNAQNLQRFDGRAAVFRFIILTEFGAHGKNQAEGRAFAQLAQDFNLAFVPLDDADNWLHLILAVGMVGLGVFLSPRGAGVDRPATRV